MRTGEGQRRWAGKEFFSTGEAAEICHVSQQTIIRHFDAGRLRGHRVPGSRFRRIPRAELIRFLRENDLRTDALENPILRVLVLDDDAAFLAWLRHRVGSSRSIEWRVAQTGFEAGLATERYDPRLLLIDPARATVDAEALCRELTQGRGARVPRVLIVSERLHPGDAERLVDAGADQVFSKSHDRQKLAHRIEREIPDLGTK